MASLFPPAIARGIRIARAHPAVRDVRVIETSAEGVLLEVDVSQQLPSVWSLEGQSPRGVRALETAHILLPAEFPRRSPRVFLRPDFDRNHPHLLPAPADQPPQPCIVQGLPSELIQARGFEGYLDQLVDWLDKAAMLELNSAAHGWEPVQRDHLDDELIADPKALHALADGSGSCTILRTDFVKYASERTKLIRVAVNPHERLELDSAHCELQQVQNRPWWRGRGIAMIVGTSHVVDVTLPETVSNISDLRERARLYGYGQAFEAKLNHLAFLLSEGRFVPTPLAVVFLVHRPFRVVGTTSCVEICSYVVDLQAGSALLDDRGDVRLCGLREDISQALLRRASGDSEAEARPSWALIGAGSVGSKVAIHLARRGFGPSMIVDRAMMSPHNYARHGLLPEPRARGGTISFKVDLLAEALSAFDQGVESERDDILAVIGEAGCPRLAGRSHLLNTTGSSLVREVLAFERWDARPVLGEAHLLGAGAVAYAAFEGPGGNPNLSDLAAESYRLVADDPDVRGVVFGAEAEAIAIGQGCGAVTFPLADSRLGSFAGGLAEVAARWLREPDPVAVHGRIHIAKLSTDGLSQAWMGVSVEPWTVVEIADQQVRISPSVDVAIRQAIASRPGVETGGVIVGRYSQLGGAFQVVDLIAAPPDSVFTAERFTLGTVGLRGAIARLGRETGGALYVLGTWHNHLMPSGPSMIDAATAARLALRQFFPVLMLIAHDGGYSGIVAEIAEISVAVGGKPYKEGSVDGRSAA